MSKRPQSEGAEEIIGRYFPVLDHGFVSLVDYMGTDEDIERAARNPTIKIVEVLAKALGVSAADLPS